MPNRMIHLKLPSNFVLQMLDGLDARREAYERTALYMEGAYSGDEPIEEVRSAEEAEDIAADYKKMIAMIDRQMRSQE